MTDEPRVCLVCNIVSVVVLGNDDLGGGAGCADRDTEDRITPSLQSPTSPVKTSENHVGEVTSTRLLWEMLPSRDQTGLETKILVSVSVLIWWISSQSRSWHQTFGLGLKVRINCGLDFDLEAKILVSAGLEAKNFSFGFGFHLGLDNSVSVLVSVSKVWSLPFRSSLKASTIILLLLLSKKLWCLLFQFYISSIVLVSHFFLSLSSHLILLFQTLRHWIAYNVLMCR